MGDYPDRQRSAAHGNSDSDNLFYKKNGTGTWRQYICKTKGMCGFGREILWVGCPRRHLMQGRCQLRVYRFIEKGQYRAYIFWRRWTIHHFGCWWEWKPSGGNKGRCCNLENCPGGQGLPRRWCTDCRCRLLCILHTGVFRCRWCDRYGICRRENSDCQRSKEGTCAYIVTDLCGDRHSIPGCPDSPCVEDPEVTGEDNSTYWTDCERKYFRRRGRLFGNCGDWHVDWFLKDT